MSPSETQHFKRFKNACFEAIVFAEEGNHQKAEQWLGLAQSELKKLTNKKAPVTGQG